MKKLLCVLLAAMAITTCFAGCTDGKCDRCETTEYVKAYTIADQKEKKEFCGRCATLYAIEQGVILKPVED